jgi:4-hydroxy-tetrahydrodipicolinate synthase
MVGVDTAVYHGFINCGATGAITGIGNAIPKEVLHLVALCKKAAEGHAEARLRAKELEEALAVLSSFDEGPDLVLYYKHLMVLNGDTEYTLHFNETDALNDAQRNYVEAQYKLFKTWYADWSTQGGVIAECA